MAHGSEDYWMTKGRLLADLIDAIKTSVTAGGDLLTKLDAIDGTIDGRITLSDLNSAECQMLAKLTNIDTTGAKNEDLLTKLDALDGTIDGKLDITQLENAQVFYDAVAGKSRLEVAIEKLTTQVERLTSIRNMGYGTATSVHSSGTQRLSAGSNLIVGAWSLRTGFRCRLEGSDTPRCEIGYSEHGAQAVLEAGDSWGTNDYCGAIYAIHVSGTCDLAYEEW